MRKLLCIIFIVSYVGVKAQPSKEAYNWYFGQGCKIDFSSGTAISTISPALFFVSEGCAIISDANTGQFLFFVAATQIINKNNTLMYNGSGLIGNEDATQASLIIPKPDSSSIYYIITADHSVIGNKGVHYSVVDLNKQGGLGAVTIKNQVLTPPPTTEKLVGIKNCNGKDYWILTHPHNSDAFNAYKVTSTGIDLNPIVSHTGVVHQHLGSPYSGSGYLKSSPDGKKIAIGLDFDSIPLVQIFDFDNSTGIVSNPITITYPETWGAYGLSFSPNNSKLYTVPHTLSNDSSFLYQYDLSSNTSSAIIASQTLIAITKSIGANNWLGALQMAPDGKIYIARFNVDTLAVINNPNNAGASCNFNYSQLPLAPSTKSIFGLPNFIDANYAGINLNIPDVKQCASLPFDTLNAGTGFSSYQWSTGVTTNSIVINAPGKYWVTVTNQQGCVKTDTVNAYVINPVKKDTSVCVFYTANAAQNAVLTYNWYDSTTTPIKTFTTTGTYWIDVAYVGGCSIRDTFNIAVNSLPIVDLGPDTTFCLGNLALNAFNPSSTYNWSTGQTTPSITATNAASYWVKVTTQFGCVAYDTLIVHPETSLFNFEMPNIITPNGDNLNDEIDFGKYQFSSLQLEIYDRWGLKVFESSDPACIWKPTANNNDGTYFTNLQYRIDCGAASQTKKINNFITLVR